MAILKNEDITKRFYLPTTQDLADESPDKAWVDLNIGPLTAGDIINIDPEGDKVSSAINLLTNRIKEWNFTSETGESLAITFDNVRHLDIKDFSFLADQIPNDVEGLTVPEKKS
jgi:hypothetical protein